MTHDRVRGDEFQLTQQFLGQMLGERRASVNAVASVLQRAGLIQYVRGQITVLDRRGLESASCDCYRIVRDEYDRMLGPQDSKGQIVKKVARAGKATGSSHRKRVS